MSTNVTGFASAVQSDLRVCAANGIDEMIDMRTIQTVQIKMDNTSYMEE